MRFHHDYVLPLIKLKKRFVGKNFRFLVQEYCGTARRKEKIQTILLQSQIRKPKTIDSHSLPFFPLKVPGICLVRVGKKTKKPVRGLDAADLKSHPAL